MLSIKQPIHLSIAIILCFISSSVSAFNTNRQFVLNLSSGYGYLLGQEILLDNIANQYPDLAREAYLAKVRFNTKFPNLKDKHFKVINSLDIPEVNQAFKESTKQLQALVSANNKNLSKSEAIDFINEVNNRANGDIESPFLENFLVVQYNDKPQQEMLDGFYNTFSSQGLSKAKGLNVTIKTPKSWQEQEADRPNIVKKWISQNGTGLDTIMLVVKNSFDSEISLNDVEELYTMGEIYEVAPKGMSVVDKGTPIVLDGLPGYWFRVEGERMRLDSNLYISQILYTIFYKDKAIAIQCGTANNLENKSEVYKRVKELQPLCKSVVNSLVIQNQWKQ